MLFEIFTTATMLGVLGASSYYKSSSNDVDKIVKIANNSGLSKSDESIRIYRRHHNKKKNYTEYVFKIPYGLEAKDFQDKIGKFKDGLNNRSQQRVNLKQLKELDLNKNVLKQIQNAFNHREPLNREVELEYDGMLKVRVYDRGLETKYPISENSFKQTNPWTIPLGVTLNNRILHNFEKAKHILVGGATDTGKSTILNVITSGLIAKHPDDVKFTFLDLKGGLEFSMYEHLEQTQGFANNVEESLDVLLNVQNDMNKIFKRLKREGKRDVKQLGITERHFVIIDEAAELSTEDETDAEVRKIKVKCEGIIKDLARRGRASGIRLIYATQYPTKEAVSSQVKRNLLTRICLPVDTNIASRVVLDEPGAEELPIIPGRAYYKHHKKSMMQSYFIEDSTIERIIKPYRRERRASYEIQAEETSRSHLAKFEET